MFKFGKMIVGDKTPNATEGAVDRLWSEVFRDRRGVTAVEFAMVLPVFLTVVLGTVELGRAFQAWNEASHALGRAIRVVNLDANKSPVELATLLEAYLAGINTKTP